jgi:hypothetical protein
MGRYFEKMLFPELLLVLRDAYCGKTGLCTSQMYKRMDFGIE